MTTTVSRTDVQAVRDVLSRFYDGWNAADADACVALYLPDATVTRQGGFLQGRTAVRDYLAAAFAGPFKGSRAIDTPQDIRIIDGHTAIVTSTAGVLLPGEQSVPADRQLRATWVMSKKDGQWLVAAYVNTPEN